MNTATLILSQITFDCDGSGEAFQRVTVPESLAKLVREHQAKLAEDRATVGTNQSRALTLLKEAPAYTDELAAELKPLNEARERALTRVAQQSHVVHALTRAVQGYALDTEQISGYELDQWKWYILSEEDGARYEAELQDEGGHAWDYWQEVGYHSTFNGRQV